MFKLSSRAMLQPLKNRETFNELVPTGSVGLSLHTWVILLTACFLLPVFFSYSDAFSFLDNEELFLKSKMTDSFVQFIRENWPYSLANLSFFWLSDHFILGDDINDVRLPSILIGIICVIYIASVIHSNFKSFTAVILSIILLSFSYEFQRYVHWGISGYVGAIFFSAIFINVFFHFLHTQTPTFKSALCLSLCFSTMLIFMHADLIVAIISASGILFVNFVRRFHCRETLFKSIFNATIVLSPFILPIVSVLVMMFITPDGNRDVGIRPHQQHMFFSTSEYSKDLIGFFEFYTSAFYETFRRMLVNNIIPNQYMDIFNKLYITSFFVFGILSFTKLIKTGRLFINFLFVFSMAVCVVLIALNLLDLHQIGQPRYSLYLIVPFFLVPILSLHTMLKHCANLLMQNRPSYFSLVVAVGLLALTLFALSTELSKRSEQMANIQNAKNILSAKYDGVFYDRRFEGVFYALYPHHDTTNLFNIGSGTPNRIKIAPSKRQKNMFETNKSIFLFATAFVSATTTGESTNWGYIGYEFMKERCKPLEKVASGRLLLEVWGECMIEQKENKIDSI